jgi:ankyrin repeat protein
VRAVTGAASPCDLPLRLPTPLSSVHFFLLLLLLLSQESLLHVACANGHTDIARVLLDLGSDANPINEAKRPRFTTCFLFATHPTPPITPPHILKHNR